MNDKIEKMINTFKLQTIDSAIDGFVVEHNDEITNGVREYLDSLPDAELVGVQSFLESVLNYAYGGKLINALVNEEDAKKIASLSPKELFLLKENAIYFYGRLALDSDISILKKIYELDDNKYIKLNVTFASLQSFKEDIELDFVQKILSNEEYDQLIRSWTMAYFKLVSKPYEYVDSEGDDWSLAKSPRIKRLKINDETNPKYKKAMAFRLLDLVVLYLFINNRKINDLTDEEIQTINDTKIDYNGYSEEKKKELSEVKRLILEYKN